MIGMYCMKKLFSLQIKCRSQILLIAARIDADGSIRFDCFHHLREGAIQEEEPDNAQ